MANENQLNILRQGADTWNEWREENPYDEVDLSRAKLSGADLSRAKLSGANLSGAYLSRADLSRAYLIEAKLGGAYLSGAYLSGAYLSGAYLSRGDLSRAYLSRANLSGAKLSKANLSRANLSGAKLSEADLSGADLNGADLSRADLSGADLSRADLTDTDLSEADLSRSSLIETTIVRARLAGCRIYGISAWGLILDDKTEQRDLVITPSDQPTVTVDDLEIAQFVYLLLHSDKMRRVIDTLTAKAVLILGRFTDERKVVLDAIREELRKHDYVPLLFDFDKPESRDIRETVSTLARISRFVIADITDAKSIPAELELIVPFLPSVPIMPLVLRSDQGYALFGPLMRYPWVIAPYRYMDQAELIASIRDRVISPAEKKVKECRSP